MMLELVHSVGGDQRRELLLVGRVPPEHRRERDAHTLEPVRISGRRGSAGRKGMAHRGKDQLDRIDERTIEVKKHGHGPRASMSFAIVRMGSLHRGKLQHRAIPGTSTARWWRTGLD